MQHSPKAIAGYALLAIALGAQYISGQGPIISGPPERKEQSQEAFQYVNQLRQSYGRSPLVWDERAYLLAVSRSKDMVERDYFDHVTPEGTCAKDMKAHYGFQSSEFLPENIGGMTHYQNGSPVQGTHVKEAVDGWMGSRGHRFNLMYATHTSGAVGCYQSICAFYGINADRFGDGPCTTGEQGLEFWRLAPQQSGEI